jgi:MraZ protein
MDMYCAQIASDGRVTIPKELRAKLSKTVDRGRNPVFIQEAVFIERHSNWPYVKMWVAEPSDQEQTGQMASQHSQSRIATGRIATGIDDSYRIHIPMAFRKETGLFNAIVWVVKGKEVEIWNEQKWELAASACVESEQVLLPQRELSGQIKQILESRGEIDPEAIAKIDNRGRLTMPLPLRKDFAKGIVITPALDKCLAVYSVREWQTFVRTRLPHLAMPDHLRKLNRALFATAFFLKMESSGRLSIPTPLQEYSTIEKEVIILGSPSCSYLWSSDVWRRLTSAKTDKM